MKKLEFVLFIISYISIFTIGNKIFDTQYFWFLTLSIAFSGVNLFHVWFQAHSKKEEN